MARPSGRGERRRFTGGANVPSPLFYRLNGTWPMASLTVGPDGIALRLVGLARFGLTDDLRATPDTLDFAYPLARGLLSNGIGFTDRGGHDFYFWTTETSKRGILELLRERGYRVAAESRKPKKIWTFEM